MSASRTLDSIEYIYSWGFILEIAGKKISTTNILCYVMIVMPVYDEGVVRIDDNQDGRLELKLAGGRIR